MGRHLSDVRSAPKEAHLGAECAGEVVAQAAEGCCFTNHHAHVMAALASELTLPRASREDGNDEYLAYTQSIRSSGRNPCLVGGLGCRAALPGVSFDAGSWCRMAMPCHGVFDGLHQNSSQRTDDERLPPSAGPLVGCTPNPTTAVCFERHKCFSHLHCQVNNVPTSPGDDRRNDLPLDLARRLGAPSRTSAHPALRYLLRAFPYLQTGTKNKMRPIRTGSRRQQRH